MKELSSEKNSDNEVFNVDERKNQIENCGTNKKRKRKITHFDANMGEINHEDQTDHMLFDEEENLLLQDLLSSGHVSDEANSDEQPSGSINGVESTATADDEREEDAENSVESTPPIGLKLTRTPSLMNLVSMIIFENENQEISTTQQNQGLNHNRLGSQIERSKASNFPAVTLKIGTWQWSSRNEGELVAKIYYAKQRIVWEVLDGGLKSKIEIRWSDIIGIRAVIHVNEPGLLEVELKQPPVFYRESNPQPKRHTNWNQTSDFTSGQAMIWRRHCVTFSPGVLDKHYEKLLQHDQRLFILSQQHFPSKDNPYFEFTNMYGNPEFSLSGYGSGFHPGSNYPYPTIRGAPFRSPPNPSLSAMNMPYNNQNGSNQKFLPQQHNVDWTRRTNFPATSLCFEQGGPSRISSMNQSNRAFSSQNEGLAAVLYGSSGNYSLDESQVQDTFLSGVDQNHNTNHFVTSYPVNNINGHDQAIISNGVVYNNSYISTAQPISCEEFNMNTAMEATGSNSSNGGYFSNVNAYGYVNGNQINGEGFVQGMNPHQGDPRNLNNGQFPHMDPN